MRRIALHTPDRTKYPNLVLMKLAAWHKARGDRVEVYNSLPMFSRFYDTVYSSKVFSWGAEAKDLPAKTVKGGTGYGLSATLPAEVEHICPDYDFYGVKYSLGFLTRGCIRSCPWCVVPAKEGMIREHADIEEFCRHRDVKLMDNNVLAHPHGIAQIDKMARLDLRVDFNQGLDARLIDGPIAKRLGALRWIRFLRLACDQKSQMPVVEKAVRRLRAVGGPYREYWCYVLVKEVEDAHDRVLFLQSLNVTPFAQPYRDLEGTEPTFKQRTFARWCDQPRIRKTTPWPEFWEQQRHREVAHV